jgi:hypothetical protein
MQNIMSTYLEGSACPIVIVTNDFRALFVLVPHPLAKHTAGNRLNKYRILIFSGSTPETPAGCSLPQVKYRQ